MTKKDKSRNQKTQRQKNDKEYQWDMKLAL